MQTEMLIGSTLRQGHGARRRTILNPKTGETIVKIPEASPDQVDAAVAAADKAFATWSRTTPGERAGYLLKLADRIEADGAGLRRRSKR